MPNNEFWRWKGDVDDGAGYIQSFGNLIANQETIFFGTITWTAGTTATAIQTLSVATLTAINTTVAHEVIITNDGHYDMTAAVYKIISASATFNADMNVNIAVPAIDSAGLTVDAKSVQVQGLFNIDLGLTFTLSVTAAITATVTNNVLIKELDL